MQIKKTIQILAATITAAGAIALAGGCDDGGGDGPGVAHKLPDIKKESTYSVAQEQAIKSAKSYLDMSGFSRAGLIQQLSSDAGDGYSKADATFAVDHVNADWKKEAVESAESYLAMGGFSRQGLIDQLSSPAGEQFTRAQAEYAVQQVGL